MSTIDLSPLVQAVAPLVMVAVTTIAGWAVQRWTKQLGIVIDQKQADVVEKALQGAIGFAEEWAYQQAKDRSKVSVRNEMAAQALAYVSTAVPDALNHFGLTPDAVTRLIYSRLPTPEGAPPDPVPAVPATPTATSAAAPIVAPVAPSPAAVSAA